MSWITGLNTQISKPCLQESGAHIEAEIVLDVGLGALQQGRNGGWQALLHR
jgi:hypothetical protein